MEDFVESVISSSLGYIESKSEWKLLLKDNTSSIYRNVKITAAMAQWVRAFVPQAEGWVFESQPRQNLVVKTGRDSFNAKRSAMGVSVTGPRRWPL